MEDLANVQGPDIPLTGSTWDILAKGYSKNPQATALTVCEEPEEHYQELTIARDPEYLEADELGCLSWSYKQLLVACQRISKFLLDHGIKRGSTVLLFIPNGVEWPLMLWIAFNLQLTLVPCDFRGLTEARKDQVLHLIGQLKPDLLVTDSVDRAEFLDDTLSGSRNPHISKLTFSKTKPNDQWFGYNDIVEANLYPDGNVSTNELPQDAAIDKGGERVQYILFTSGTSTGNPKGCPGRVEMVLNHVRTDYGSSLSGAASHAPRFLINSPNFRVVCVANSIRAWVHGGSTVIPFAQISWPALVASLQRFNRLCMIVFTTFPAQLAAHAGNQTFPKVLNVNVGGDIVTQDVLFATKKVFPNGNVRTGHGMTEGSGFFALKPDDMEPGSGAPPSWANMCALGKAGVNTRVRIVTARGELVKRGEVGDLHVSSLGMVTRYIEDVFPENFYTMDDRKWLVTGDRGLVDKQGYVYIIGRTKDDIKCSAMSLSPAIPEAVLNKHDDIEVSQQGGACQTFCRVLLFT